MATNAGREGAGYFGKDENGEGVLNLNGKTRPRLQVDMAGLGSSTPGRPASAEC